MGRSIDEGLKGRILAARDYGVLVDLLAEAVEAAAGKPSHCQSLLLAHPEVDDVFLRIYRKEGVMNHGRPFRGRDDFHFGEGIAEVVSADFEPFVEKYSLTLEGVSPKAILALYLRGPGDSRNVLLASFLNDVPTLSDRAKGQLASLANAFALVLPACHDFEKFRRQRNEMQEVFEAATMLQGGHDLMAIGAAAVELMGDRLGFDRALVLVKPLHGDDLLVAGALGFDADTLPKHMAISPEEGSLISRSYFNTVPVWEDISRDVLFANGAAPPADESKPNDAEAGGWNVVCLPLIDSEGKSLGVLYGDHASDLAQMSIERLIGLQLFANSVGARLETASLILQVAELAEQDGLTGLANRRSFDQHLQREVARARRNELPLSILMIDVNKFKDLNDSYGHVAGDEVLIETAELLRTCARETDFVARYGGDEFVILMPESDMTAGSALRARILETVERVAPRVNREHWTFKLSCGLKCAITDVTEDLLDQADKALYQHKMAQVRRQLLQRIVCSDEEQLLHWDHYLGKLLRVLFEKDPAAYDHCRRVMNLCIAIGRQMNLDHETNECIALAAMLHDVGKISIPSSMLNRSGPLTPEEYRLVQAHTKIGYDLLREVNYLGDACDMVRFHHERYDGITMGVKYPGYPGKLKGEQIPIGARILKVADSFDAMVTNRPYKGPKTNTAALAELRGEAGKSFDPRVVVLFADWMGGIMSASLEMVGYD